jgi:hypothetical protein
MKCPDCGNDVQPVKTFKLRYFIPLLIFGLIGGAVYVFYYLFMKKPHHCPMCGADMRGPAQVTVPKTQ